MTYVIGFTGTRSGMTEQQKIEVRRLVQTMIQETTATGLHGDCVGADADFDAICAALGVERHCRPCVYTNMRAHTTAKQIAEPVRPMQRNRDIVADAKVMIACPPNDEPIKSGSGTWATVGFAQKAHRPLHIVFPDGRVESSNVTSTH